MCIGQRGRGKTTFWLNSLIKRAYKNIMEYVEGKVDHISKLFVYLRRTEKQLEKALDFGLFNSVFKVYPETAQMVNFDVFYKNNAIFFKKDNVQYKLGYICDLNKVKGLSVEDADVLLFDEIVELKRSDYKGGDGGMHEPDILARLDETLFRRRENWHIYLGNDDQPTNPYSESFKVPYNCDKFKNKEREFMFERDVSLATTKDKQSTATGKRWKGTTYEQYSNGEIALNSIDEEFICDKPKHAKLLYNIKMCGNSLTVWQDVNTGIVYIHDNCSFNPTLPILSVMESDMSINSSFMAYNSFFIQWIKMLFARGYLRYNNQKTYSLFSVIVGLTK